MLQENRGHSEGEAHTEDTQQDKANLTISAMTAGEGRFAAAAMPFSQRGK